MLTNSPNQSSHEAHETVARQMVTVAGIHKNYPDIASHETVVQRWEDDEVTVFLVERRVA